MTFDTWTVAAVADELINSVVGGRIQQVVQVDETSLALELYASRQRHYLLASANPQAARVLLMDDKPRRGVDAPSPMLTLLRKFVRGAFLEDVTQPPWERVLELTFSHPQHGPSRLVAELIGRWANLLFLRPAREGEGRDHWRILGAVRRYRPEESTARTILPGKLYEPPPAQAGWSPDALTELRLRSLFEEADAVDPVWRVLVRGLQGFSPQLAREVVFRATGDSQSAVGQVARLTPLLQSVGEFVALMELRRWEPGIVVGETGQVLGFASYRLLHRAEGLWQPSDTISTAAERYYRDKLQAGGDPYAAARLQVRAMLERSRQRLARQSEAIKRQLRPAHEIEDLRSAGEWILALASQVGPQQGELQVPAETGQRVIVLDPGLSPVENAQRYFQRYRKAKRADKHAGPRLAAIEQDLAYLEQLASDLALADSRGDIDSVRSALVEGGYVRRSSRATRSAAPGQPRCFTSAEGHEILVGRNSQQNERITFVMAAPDDWWLHARGWPGAHVLIRSRGRAVSQETLQEAAALAAYYSRARNETWVDVMVVQRRHVRRAPGKRPGMVVVDREQVWRVQPRASLP